MDYNRNSDTPFGSDGCIDWDHEVNKGLESIWCTSCPLTKLYRKKYSHISKADFWIVSANAVIRQLSKNQSLDLANAFLWGRKDANACKGSGDRIPLGTGTCRDVEETMLDAMGLEWRDAVALLGAHTIGKGHEAVSFHIESQNMLFSTPLLTYVVHNDQSSSLVTMDTGCRLSPTHLGSINSIMRN